MKFIELTAISDEINIQPVVDKTITRPIFINFEQVAFMIRHKDKTWVNSINEQIHYVVKETPEEILEKSDRIDYTRLRGIK